MDPHNDPLQSALRAWAEDEGEKEIVRIPSGLVRLKARLAREDAEQAKVKSLQRWTLALVAFADLFALFMFHPQSVPDYRLLTLSGLSSLLPLIIAPVIFTASVVWLMED